MPDPRQPSTPPPPLNARPVPLSKGPAAPEPPKVCADEMACDRCGTGMFRMHAVWRCPNCGFKSDCCGW